MRVPLDDSRAAPDAALDSLPGATHCRDRMTNYLRQNAPVQMTNNGMISNRPRIIANAHTQLWKSVRLA